MVELATNASARNEAIVQRFNEQRAVMVALMEDFAGIDLWVGKLNSTKKEGRRSFCEL